MTNKPRWAKLQTSDINRIQGIYKTETQNIGTVSLSCWWPCFWIWVMQSYWIYSNEFLLTGETLYYPTTSVHWQVGPFTILLPQYTDRWDHLLFYYLGTLTVETLFYPTTSVHWQATVYYRTTSVSWAHSVLCQICMYCCTHVVPTCTLIRYGPWNEFTVAVTTMDRSKSW